jgi:hypothetical protein
MLNTLTISPGSTLDVTNNVVLINYGSGADPNSSILSYLSSGANGGGWNGTGIVSSTAAGNSNYGVGYSDGADGVDPNLTSGQIEVAYAQYGDISLQGLVNANDFHILSGNFGLIVTSGWEAGDFLYQGVVNAQDFHFLTSNFGQTANDYPSVLAVATDTNGTSQASDAVAPPETSKNSPPAEAPSVSNSEPSTSTKTNTAAKKSKASAALCPVAAVATLTSNSLNVEPEKPDQDAKLLAGR